LAELAAVDQSFPDAPRRVQIGVGYARKIFAAAKKFSLCPANSCNWCVYEAEYVGAGILVLSKRIYIDTFWA